jgi:hypothetical protein
MKDLKTIALASLLALPAIPALGQVGHIHELFYNNADWSDTDLTSLTGANSASSFAGMAAFVTSPNGQFHVYYQDEFSDIHEFYYNGSAWSDSDLTTVTGGAGALSGGSAMSGFSVGNFQYVYFVAWNQHIHEYSYVDNWVDTDLTALTGDKPLAGPAYDGKHLVAVLTSDNHRHVFFATKNGDIEQLTFNGSSWSKQNVSGKKRAKANINSFDYWMGACNINTYSFVFFSDPDFHLHEFSYIRRWTDTDLTAQTGVTTGGSVSVLSDPGISVCAVFYNDSNGDVHQISNSGTGVEFENDQNLTVLTGASANIDGAAGFSTSPNNQIHFYTSSSSGVNQFYFNGTSWSFQNLPGGSYWEPYGLAGFNVGNEQHVYYLASAPD